MRILVTIANGIVSVVEYMLRLCGAKIHRYFIRNLFSRLPQNQQADYIMTNPHILSNRPIAHDLKIEMLTPSPVKPDVLEQEMVERIYIAFRKAKQDQKDKDAVFLPSTMWKEILDLEYPTYPDTNIDQFHFFLTNFGAIGRLGITWRYLVERYIKTSQSRKYFEECIIGQKVRWWLRSESNGCDVSALSHPRYGNQWGAKVNNNFISFESVLNEFYGRMISGFVKKDRPIVGEIGAGYGILFYFISKAFSNFCFLDFDLPETLICATYYLMKCFPKKKFLLYGEGKLNEKAIKENDFIFMPSYTIQELPDESVDIFVNNSSLGEMKPMTCSMFVREICRTANAFWHLNHEHNRVEFKDGTVSLLNREYPISTEKFDLVIRYIDALNAA